MSPTPLHFLLLPLAGWMNRHMQWMALPLPPPGPNEVQLRTLAAGVNFIDTYHRSGLYPLPLPTGLGLEGAAVVEAVGNDVHDFQVGDRVA